MVCRNLTRLIRTEVDRQDVVTKACEVFQLSEVALQRAAGKVCFVERCHKTKHEGIQTGWPFVKNTHVRPKKRSETCKHKQIKAVTSR